MIYETQSERLQDMGTLFDNEKEQFRMARVMELENGRPIVRFSGETANAKKKYKYLSSYYPAIGDKVIMIRISGTYVILGKVV